MGRLFHVRLDSLRCARDSSRMERLTDTQYDRVRRAAKLLNKAGGDMPLLGSVAWDASQRDRFLKDSTTPAPVYTPIDTSEARLRIAKARKLASGEGVVQAWLQRLADTLETTAHLIDARGTADFYTHSTTLFSTPEKVLIDRTTRTIDLAHHLNETLSDLSFDHLVMEGDEVELEDTVFAEQLRARLTHHFGNAQPEVVLTPDLSAKATASSKRIRVRKGATFTERDVHQLLQHEALIHTATALNGRTHDGFRVLGRAHAGTTMIQEGLAVFAEIITGAMDPRRFQRLAQRVIAIQNAVDGADFQQTYDYFLESTDDPRGSYESARRIFRGGVMTGGAPFTKDGVYLNGLLRVHNFMRTVVKLNRADLIRILFMGKMDIEDIPAIAQLAANDRLARPPFLPPWVRDMRFLVSYMSYSSFLNRVKLPGFQRYYEDHLADVPRVWDAVG